MRAQLSNRDYEQLSAYIDGQLAPGERRRLEERIHNQPELQTALDELNRTRALLQQAPRRHAPRNFTLTPEMIGEANLRRKRSRNRWNFNLFPILSFTSALASLALVALIIFQLLPGASQTALTTGAQPAMAPQAARETANTESARAAGGAASATSAEAQNKTLPAAEPTQMADQSQPAAGAAPMAGAAPAATEPAALMQAPAGAAAKAADSGAAAPPIIAWNGAPPYGGNAGATGMGGGGGDGRGGGGLPMQGGLLGPPAANDTYGSVPSGQEIYGMGGGGGGTGTSPLTGPVNLPAESVNSLENNAAARDANPSAPVNNNIQGAGPILGVAQAGQGGQIIEQRSLVGSPDGVTQQAAPAAASQPTDTSGSAAAPAQPAPTQGRNPANLQLIEGVLALIALVTGGAAFYLWRRSR